MTAITAVVPASATVVSDNTAPTAAKLVVVGSVTYTWRASVSTTANELKIEAACIDSMTHLFNAINGVSDAGVGSLTVANPDVVATDHAANSGLTVTVKARVPGTAGNFINISEDDTHTSIGGSATKLAGGTGSVAVALSEILAGCQLNAEVEQLLKSFDGDPTAQ